MNRRELLRSIGLLLGGAASATLVRAVSAASSGRRSPEKPLFDPEARRKVELICELIIPTTDTPGAIAAGVPDFVEMMVGEWYDSGEKAAFFQGLKDMDIWCSSSCGAPFGQASEVQQIAALREFEKRAIEQPGASDTATESTDKVDVAAPFFTSIRELVIVGYYTSEVGARQEHKFFRMSTTYDGDYPLSRTDGRQWSY